MLSTTLAAFIKDTNKYLDNVIDNHETLLINRGKDTGVVIIYQDEYNSLVATCHSSSSKVNESQKRQNLEKKLQSESALVMEESMNVLHEFEDVENAHYPTMEIDGLIQNPKSEVREGWEQSFEKMHANGDDQLLIPDVFEDESFEEWK